MTKIYCNYCGKEVAQSKAIDITLIIGGGAGGGGGGAGGRTINNLHICTPTIYTNKIAYQFCPDCWAHIRDNILNKAYASKEETK